jgi:hypothetical protein
MASLEPILLAPPQKALVNLNTHRTITDILADLTFNFGGEKGCEPLVDMWKKVKMPQEPDKVCHDTTTQLTRQGRPLSDDHAIFVPEAQYPTHMLDHHENGRSHHDAYMGANGQDGYAAYQQRDQPAGPGYANLPSHSDDMRRLIEESTAGKEAARVLSEALVYSRPEDLDQRPVIRVSRLNMASLTGRNSTTSASMPMSLSRTRWIGRKRKPEALASAP